MKDYGDSALNYAFMSRGVPLAFFAVQRKLDADEREK